MKHSEQYITDQLEIARLKDCEDKASTIGFTLLAFSIAAGLVLIIISL